MSSIHIQATFAVWFWSVSNFKQALGQYASVLNLEVTFTRHPNPRWWIRLYTVEITGVKPDHVARSIVREFKNHIAVWATDTVKE